MKSFSCVTRCLDTDVSSSVSKRLRMPMRSAEKRWICQLGSFLLFEHFSFFSFYLWLWQQASTKDIRGLKSTRPYAVSLKASSLWTAARVIFFICWCLSYRGTKPAASSDNELRGFCLGVNQWKEHSVPQIREDLTINSTVIWFFTI